MNPAANLRRLIAFYAYYHTYIVIHTTIRLLGHLARLWPTGMTDARKNIFFLKPTRDWLPHEQPRRKIFLLFPKYRHTTHSLNSASIFRFCLPRIRTVLL